MSGSSAGKEAALSTGSRAHLRENSMAGRNLPRQSVRGVRPALFTCVLYWALSLPGVVGERCALVPPSTSHTLLQKEALGP